MILPLGAGLRVRSSAIALWAVVLALAVPATRFAVHAHDGHDHGPPVTALPSTAQPRAATTGDEFEAVAVLKGGELVVFVDRFADNAPLTQAAVTVTIGTQEFTAQPSPDGTYRVAWPPTAGPGRHDVVIGIQDGATADLLIATLEVPAAISALPSGAISPNAMQRLQGWLATSPLVATLIGLVIMALAATFVRRRNTPPNKAPTALLLAAVVAGSMGLPNPPAIAHDGHDHGDNKNPPLAATGDAPRRLPDGSVFLPKPTQRLLGVRTVLVREAPHRPSQTFVGRVIANPNRSGLVQSSTGGRVAPPAKGLPRLGQFVKAGEILATVTQAFQAIDRANVAQTAGDLDQQIELARTKLERLQRLVAGNAAPRAQMEETEVQLKGFERRRAALNTSQIRSEALVAPVDGVISSTRAVPGQVVAPQDILFEIIDTNSLWVEALVFDVATSQRFEQPVASTSDGKAFPLTFVGRSRSLRQQSAILHFEIKAPPASLAGGATLDVGTPVTVHAQAGEPISAIVLPKAAVVRSANGEDVVWRHTEPERFVPTPVKVAPFDGARVLVQAGLSSGERIVVQSAELVSQVR